MPYFGINFSAVLYITNVPSIQMIEELIGNTVVYLVLWYTVFGPEISPPPRVTQLPSDTLCITTIYTYNIKEVV